MMAHMTGDTTQDRKMGTMPATSGAWMFGRGGAHSTATIGGTQPMGGAHGVSEFDEAVQDNPSTLPCIVWQSTFTARGQDVVLAPCPSAPTTIAFPLHPTPV